MLTLITIIVGIFAAGFVSGFAVRAALSACRHRRAKWGSSSNVP
jgi:hypothetical protein